jgi:hypothetical protein
MGFKSWALVVVLVATRSFAVQCSGDCQPGAISGPNTSGQVVEFTTTGAFPVCHSSGCTEGSWSGDQIEGIDAEENIGTGYQWFNSTTYNLDENVAVGPTVGGENAQVLEWVNSDFVQAFDKLTGQPIFTTAAGGTMAVPVNVARLWSSSTQAECQGNGSGNVQVIYDRPDGAFVISRRVVYTNSAGVHEYAWCVAASSGSDLSSPSTQWYAYEFKMVGAIPCVPASSNCTTGSYYYYFPDWPRIGTWSNGFYITFDLQDPAAGYIEAGFEACQLDRADIVQGNPANPMTCYNYIVPQVDRPTLIHSVDVADIDSASGPPSNEPEYFLSIVNPSNSQVAGQKGLHVCNSATTPCTSNQLALFTWGTNGFTGPTFIPVNPYTPGCYNTSKGSNLVPDTYCVPEPSTNAADIGAYGTPSCGNYFKNTPCLDSLGDRMANRLTYNRLSTSGGPDGEYLTASHVVMESASNQRTGIRYYVLRVSSGTASVLVNSGGSGPPDLKDPSGNLFYFMPSAALDESGDLGFTYTTSGAFCSTCQTQPHPAINFDVLPWQASSFDPPTLIVQGAGDQENAPNFGEYAATVIDSTDDLTFYGVGEYYNKSQTGTTDCGVMAGDCHTWQSRIFRGQYGVQF